MATFEVRENGDTGFTKVEALSAERAAEVFAEDFGLNEEGELFMYKKTVEVNTEKGIKKFLISAYTTVNYYAHEVKDV